MSQISKEYGTALFMLACEKDQKSEYAKALESVQAVLKDAPDYMEFLYSPAIPKEERLASLDAAFSQKVPEDVLSYMKLLCEKGRILEFSESVEDYLALLAESERVMQVKITSAVALTEAEKEKLCKKIENAYKCSVQAEYTVDASLVGGIVAEVDGKILDGSLKSRLRDIKEVIST